MTAPEHRGTSDAGSATWLVLPLAVALTACDTGRQEIAAGHRATIESAPAS